MKRLALLALLPLLTLAGTDLDNNNEIHVQNSAQHVAGALHLNISAGSYNQSINATQIATGCTVQGGSRLAQQQEVNVLGNSLNQIDIGQGAFNHNSGLLAVNLLAGNANQAINQASILQGALTEQDDNLLAQQLAQVDGPAKAVTGGIRLSPQSLKGNSGIVQLSAVSGERNQVANHIQIRLPQQ